METILKKLQKNKVMTTQAQEIEKAKAAFTKFGSISRFKIEIEKGLKEVNEIIKKELRFSKDLRNVEYLQIWLNQRHYYKYILKQYK
jgi:hypothetical protein